MTTEQAVFLLGQGSDRLVGLVDPHGGWLQWLDPTGGTWGTS